MNTSLTQAALAMCASLTLSSIAWLFSAAPQTGSISLCPLTVLWHIKMEKVSSCCSNTPINHLWQFMPLISLEMKKNAQGLAQSVGVECARAC